MKFRLSLFAMFVAAAVSGCNQSSTPEAATKPTDTPPASGPVAMAPGEVAVQPAVVQANPAAAPDQVVKAFLVALSQEDVKTAEKLLTSTAAAETRKGGLKLKKPGSPSATFRFGKVSMTTADEAQVISMWSDKTVTGEKDSFEIIWVLKNKTDGWRVQGMATRVAMNQKPIFLDFEKPAEMEQQWQRADEMLSEQLPAGGRKSDTQPASFQR